MDAAITPLALKARLAAFPPPTLVDVRRQPAFAENPEVIARRLRRLPESGRSWARRWSRGGRSSCTACAATK
jgi:hypothetical protein